MNPYRNIKDILCKTIDSGEASAIAFLLLEKVAGMDRMHVLMGDSVSSDMEDKLMNLTERIAKGEPVQYVIGETDFCGITVSVGNGVLIPRPETEELVEWIASDISNNSNKKKILDIGTGSGCIAISLAHIIHESEVEAWDISDDALTIATANAERNGVEVKFNKVDILNDSIGIGNKYDVIVSNPPYICHSESKDMESHVLDYEPHIALFVPDNDPLLFYRKIAETGMNILNSGGAIYFEINRRYGKQTMEMLEKTGYVKTELRKDQFGNDRMIKAIKK